MLHNVVSQELHSLVRSPDFKHAPFAIVANKCDRTHAASTAEIVSELELEQLGLPTVQVRCLHLNSRKYFFFANELA